MYTILDFFSQQIFWHSEKCPIKEVKYISCCLQNKRYLLIVTTNCLLIKGIYLLKECHGKLLVRDAVFGCADVLLGLIRDVKVDPHEDILLQKRIIAKILTLSVLQSKSN